METRETRDFHVAEFRVEGEGGNTLIGHAATFDDPYEVWDFDEQIKKGAFDEAIKDDDVRALFNHNPDKVLGRKKAGTLRLSTDKVGLVSEIDLPDTPTGNEVRTLVERGDVDQMSFAFSVVEEAWEHKEKGRDLRTIIKASLHDVSPVTYPANPKTDIAVRSHETWLESEKPDLSHVHATRKRRNAEQVALD